MASSDVVVAHSAFDALRLGRSAQFIFGRLLRFWDSKNIKKQGEFMGITLVLLDEKNSVIHGFIPSGRSPYYRPLLKAGSVVRVSRFEVARCTNMYKITDHPFVIRFIPQTTIDEVVPNAPMINVEKFMIRKFDPLQALANTNLELPDVVGQIQSVQGSDLTAAGVMSRVVVRLMIEPGLISSGDRTQSVMVVTTVNPKIFGGNLYLNSTPATKFYFDPALQAIVEFTASLNAPLGEAFPCIDTKDGIKKKEVVSIGELNKFITNSDEQTQEADFICKARVMEVLKMASSDVVVAHSAFDALRLGRSAQFTVGRLLRFWDSKNIKKQGEFMGITLLLLDEKNSVIHGFIPAGRSPYYRPLLKASSVVRVSRFEVARCTNMYKITDHPFVIWFIPQTTIDEVVANAPMINVEKFMIRKFDPLQALANTNLELSDVVGQIQSVQGSDLTAAGVMSRVVVRLMIEPMVVVYLSLWDDAASMFRGLISSGDRTQSVMVVTTVNPKIFGGNLYLNSTPATKFYFDPALQAIVEFTTSLNAPLGEAFPCIDTKDGIKKKEVVSIGELNKFITNSDEQVKFLDPNMFTKMASSDVVVAHSAFDALRLGRSTQFIVGCLLRFWDSKNIKKQGEFMGITLLLLDEKNSVIHRFIPAGRSPYYRSLLKAGSVVRVSCFEVARFTNMYKITDHPFVIRFIPQTTIDEVVANAPVINIQPVQGSDLTAAGVMSRVVVRLMIEPMVVVYLSLWDDVASMFRGLISSGDRTQSVMVVTTVNPKIFASNLYLNSTPATKFYFDPALQAIVEFTASLNAPWKKLFPASTPKMA
ncbi:hypothetical protein F2Q69_00021439 [Brassica cretica]|uniref:Replication protein A 70 kDa DNA-binding subunit B/D first OB fold domain-containing protein n=1 Tax=Brassica cretica TaxID=69181 RepID=A0A8S9Q684_BRACR|nr:hypothetical protein F2Q69_00021439 [Brassica cretica]